MKKKFYYCSLVSVVSIVAIYCGIFFSRSSENKKNVVVTQNQKHKLSEKPAASATIVVDDKIASKTVSLPKKTISFTELKAQYIDLWKKDRKKKYLSLKKDLNLYSFFDLPEVWLAKNALKNGNLKLAKRYLESIYVRPISKYILKVVEKMLLELNCHIWISSIDSDISNKILKKLGFSFAEIEKFMENRSFIPGIGFKLKTDKNIEKYNKSRLDELLKALTSNKELLVWLNRLEIRNSVRCRLILEKANSNITRDIIYYPDLTYYERLRAEISADVSNHTLYISPAWKNIILKKWNINEIPFCPEGGLIRYTGGKWSCSYHENVSTEKCKDKVNLYFAESLAEFLFLNSMN